MNALACSLDAAQPRDWLDALRAWQHAGMDVVLFPEFAWLTQYAPSQSLDAISKHVWEEAVPALQAQAAALPGLLVLGTAPYRDPDVGCYYNRAVILREGVLIEQDKCCLTPWEQDFRAGARITVFDYKQRRFAVLICLDIEVPEWAVRLRPEGVDCLLVPASTETALGYARVQRCASARAVELGCYVLVSHLLGEHGRELLSENVGNVAFYAPSQQAFAGLDASPPPCLEQGPVERSFKLDFDHLDSSRSDPQETNPARLRPEGD